MKHTLAPKFAATKVVPCERIGPAKCLCYRGWEAMWLVKERAVVCLHCDEERSLPGELTGIVVAFCSCGAGQDATWFATADGSRVCSNCGERR